MGSTEQFLDAENSYLSSRRRYLSISEFRLAQTISLVLTWILQFFLQQSHNMIQIKRNAPKNSISVLYLLLLWFCDLASILTCDKWKNPVQSSVYIKK